MLGILLDINSPAPEVYGHTGGGRAGGGDFVGFFFASPFLPPTQTF